MPRDYESDKDLAKWVKRQREYYGLKRLREDRQKLLEGLGFVWKRCEEGECSRSHRTHLSSEDWDEQFDKVRELKAAKKPLPKALHRWLAYQRRKNREGRIEPVRAQKLLSIPAAPAIDWEERWEENFKRLVAFKKQHGHFSTDKTIFKDAGHEHRQFSVWVKHQGGNFLCEKMRKDRRDRLDSWWAANIAPKRSR